MTEPTTCPSCGELASGRFCSTCGAPLAGATCASCEAALAPGAKFCHSCGVAVGQTSRGNSLPWLVAGIAVLAVVAIVLGQRLWSSNGPSADAAPQDATAGQPMMGQAPDISQMSPQERAQRLSDRMMAAFERGHTDTVQMFAPMAFEAYQMLDSLTVGDRYDVGRLGEITGNIPLARAEADTILHAHPTNLLGLILAAHAAKLRGDEAAEHQYIDRFLKAEPTERTTQRPEYLEHINDITAAVDAAKRPAGNRAG
jgi:hypothetical protein